MSDVNHLSVAMRDRGGSRPSSAAETGPLGARRSVDRAVAELAAEQHGVVAHRQFRALGISRSAIHRRTAVGRLHPIHVGVYAVGHPALTAHGHRMAAVLACGPDAVLSHRDAAALHGLRPSARAAVDVTVPRPDARARAGIDVHRVKALYGGDCGEQRGIPVTTVPRTLLDLAEVVRPRELAKAFEEAERHRVVDPSSFDPLFARSRGRRGLKHLRPLVDDLAPPQDTRSALESAFSAFCQAHAISPPATNVLAAGFTVDALWPAQRLVVELDGYAYHGTTRAAFERDRARDAALLVAGYRVVRITARRLEREPAGVARTLRALLEATAR